MDRITAVQSAFFGTPVRETEAIELLTPVLSEFQLSRLDSAVSDTFAVYPDMNGYYTVLSPTTESDTVSTQTGKQYRVDMLYENARTCTCEDFQFNHTVSEGTHCKHIWKIQLCINQEILPEPTTPVMPWAYAVIDDDIETVKSLSTAYPDSSDVVDHTSVSITRLNNLRNSFFAESYHNRSFVDFCQSRAYILTDFQELLR